MAPPPGALLVVDQDFPGHPAEVLQAADQALIGVLGVLSVGAPEVKAPGVTELVDQEVHLGASPGDLGDRLAPVALQLPGGTGLEAHRGSPRPQRSLGGEVLPQHGDTALIAFALELAQDDHRVPHLFGQQLIHSALEGIQLAAAAPCQALRRAAASQGPAHRLGVDTQLQGDMLLVDAALVK